MALNLSKLMKQKGPPLQGAPPDMAGLMANGAPPPPAGPGPAGGLGALMGGVPAGPTAAPGRKPKVKRGKGRKGY